MIFVTFFIIIFLFILLSFVWPPDSPWSPWWRTNKKVSRAACKLAGITKKDIVYELGSGDGEFILCASNDYGVKKAVGIEIDYSRYFISVIRKLFSNSKNAKFIRADFKRINLSDATVVYFYLVPAVIKRIMPKLLKELKPGTKILSYRYKVPLKLVSKNEERIYLYEIK